MAKVPQGQAQCDICKWMYPAGLINIFRTNAPDLDGRAVCGICALDLNNAVHGTNRQTFNGEVAEYTRQSAIRWRETHPYNNPQLRGNKRTKDDTTGTGTK